jgi:hypothetical protein
LAWRWRPLGIGIGVAAAVRVVLLVIFDHSDSLSAEGSYLAAADGVVRWLGSAPGSGGLENPLLALFWHNPGYSALVTLFALLFGDPWAALAALQSLFGLVSGLLVFALLSRSVSRPFALAGAVGLWLHPSVLYFEHQVSSVSLSTMLCAALAYTTLRLADDPESAPRQWRLGLALLPLPWLGSGGLLLVPVVAAVTSRTQWHRCIGPAVALWLPAMVVASLWLGMLTPLSLDAPTRVALGNNPLVRVGQGSLLGNPEASSAFQSAIEERCGRGWSQAQLRCGARSARRIVAATVASNPTAAVRRAVFRVLQTWVPDRALADALQSGGRDGEGISRLWRLIVALILTPLHLGLLAGLGVAILNVRRSPELRFLLLAILAWTLPVVFSVGATSLRQAALPWLLSASLLGIKVVGRRSGPERRVGASEEPSAEP